jgi:hypothetical protein
MANGRAQVRRTTREKPNGGAEIIAKLATVLEVEPAE